MDARSYEGSSMPLPDHVFCRHCCKINSLLLLSQPWFGPTIRDLSRSKSSCVLCNTIYEALEQADALEGDPERRSVLRLVNDYGDQGDFWIPRYPFYTIKYADAEELAILNGKVVQFASESIDIAGLRTELDKTASDMTQIPTHLFSLIDALGDAAGSTQPLLTLNDFRKFHGNVRLDSVAGLAIDIEGRPSTGAHPGEARHGFQTFGPTFRDRQTYSKDSYGMTRSLLCEDAMILARTWLQDCRRSYRFCHRSLEDEDYCVLHHPKPLPTRVIDLAGDGSPRLLETDGDCGDFAALSYRQGQGSRDSLILTKDNRPSLINQQLPIDQLGGTITDAIHVARKLHLQYLWVDLICIVQDDDDDFEREIASMARIYQSATVTLAVLGDRNSVSGFSGSTPRAPRFSIPWLERRPSGDVVQVGDLPVYEYCAFEGLGAKARLEAEIRKSTWNSRAWTFQEQLLSRRLLYFGESELFWECHMAVRSSYGYDDFFIENPMSLEQPPLPLFWTLSRQAGFYRCLADCIEHDTTDTREFRHRSKIPLTIFRSSWLLRIEKFVRRHLNVDVPGDSVNTTKLIYDYTQRELAYPGDKLAAFEGLVKVIARRTGQNYIAGMTSTHLAKSLFWCSAHGSMKLSTPLVAPSWSWASQEGAIRGFEIDEYDELERSEQYLRLVRDENFAGCLKNILFREGNPTVGTGRGARPVTLQADGLCLRCCRSLRYCASYSDAIAELQSRVRIWPRWYRKWPDEACHFMYIDRGKAHRPDTASGGDHGSVLDDSEILSENLIGVAYFDKSEEPPSTFEAILIWHSREPLQAVRDYQCKIDSGELVVPLSFIVRLAVFSIQTRRYFLLLVEPLDDAGTYRRIGIGIGF